MTSLVGFGFLVCGRQLTLVETATCWAQLSGEYETTFSKQANWVYSTGLSVPGLCSASTRSSAINPVGFIWTRFTLPRPNLLSHWSLLVLLQKGRFSGHTICDSLLKETG